MVRLTGLEPVRETRGILSPLRLPITPQSHCLVSVAELESAIHGPKPRVSPSTPHRVLTGATGGI